MTYKTLECHLPKENVTYMLCIFCLASRGENEMKYAKNELRNGLFATLVTYHNNPRQHGL